MNVAARFFASALSRRNLNSVNSVLTKALNPPTQFTAASFHLSCLNFLPIKKETGEFIEPSKWTAKNDKIYPPQEIGEPRRPAWVCHMRSQIRYSAKKMYYVACLVRGLSIDEALKQLTFLPDKGASIVKEILLEAQEMAVAEHNVEYKSNLWIADSNVLKGSCVKGFRRHARKRWGIIRWNYCHYFVRLEEGDPPEHYYGAPLTGNQRLEKWLQRRRNRRILHAL